MKFYRKFTNFIQSLQLNPVVPAITGKESRVSRQSGNTPFLPRPTEYTSRPRPPSPIWGTPKPRPRAQSAPQPLTLTTDIVDGPPLPPITPQRRPRASNLAAPSGASSRGTSTPPHTFPFSPTDVREEPRSSSTDVGEEPHSTPTDVREEPQLPHSSKVVSPVRNTFAPRPRSPPLPEHLPPQPSSLKPPSTSAPSP